MKKQSCTWHKMIVGILVLLTVGIGHAQYEAPALKVTVPFNFNVGPTVFSAGEYGLKPLLQNTLLLRNETGEVLTSISTNSIESKETPSSAKLVFHRYGGQYFLTQVWQPEHNIGQEVVKSSAEMEMARKYSPGQKIAISLVAQH
jgi:hypothetical protein